jgi:hypothetical protein
LDEKCFFLDGKKRGERSIMWLKHW